MLGVSITTSRRWDEKEKLKAERKVMIDPKRVESKYIYPISILNSHPGIFFVFLFVFDFLSKIL